MGRVTLDGKKGQDMVMQNAFERVLTVFADAAFQEALRSRTIWLTRGENCIPGEHDEAGVTGDVVIESVIKPLIGAHPEGTTPWNLTFAAQERPWEEAVGTACPAPAISIRNSIVNGDEKYEGKTPEDAASTLRDLAYLDGTIAHELTHTVRADSPDCAIRYLDRGFDSCTKKFLVSYRIGLMVRCWRRGVTDPAELAKCVGDGDVDRECMDQVNAVFRSCGGASYTTR